ncbi:MAG: isochorismatase family protein [Gammaproteobacteria bacterium]
MSDAQYNPLLCDADNSALIIIDIQTRLSNAMLPKVLTRITRNSGTLLTAAGKLGIPVIATEQYPQGLGTLEEGIIELLPAETKRFAKTCFSCTGADGFSEQLDQTGRKQIILTGMESHVCVLQTAMELINSGHQVFVAADAVCSRQRDNYESSLQRMQQAGVIVTNTESILFEWLRDASHEHFKTLSALIH